MLFVRFKNIITVYNTGQISAHCSFFELKVITNKIRNSIFFAKMTAYTVRYIKKHSALCWSDSYCSCVFLIQQSYGECVKDTGWFVVLDPFLTPTDCCKWSDLPNKPKFVYSKDDNMTTFQDGRKNYNIDTYIKIYFLCASKSL